MWMQPDYDPVAEHQRERAMADELICPECGTAVEPPDDLMQNLLVCPNCGHQFFIDTSSSDETEEDDEAAAIEAQREIDRARDLDGSRIRALSVERRSIIRQRSWCITAAAACVVAIVQSIAWLILGRPSTSFDTHPFSRGERISLVVLIIFCIAGVWFFVRKAHAYKVELDKPLLTEPTEPPDFEPLSDGGQAWKKLEEMAEDRNDEV